MSDLPIACRLDTAELNARRDTLLPGLAAQAVAQEVLPDGMRWRFQPSRDLLATVVTTIEAERHCCRFLRFALAVEPDQGPVTLTVTGPPGTREFLVALTQTQAVPPKANCLTRSPS